MNSVIVTAVIAFCAKIGAAFKNSYIFGILNRIYCSISNSWHKSFFVTKLKKTDTSERFKNSFLYRVIYFPFFLLEKTGEKVNGFVSKSFENSFILKSIFAFLDNALALNTRFYGLILFGFTLSRQILAFSLSIKLVIITVVWIALMLTDYNVTDFFAGSKAVKLLLSLVGFKDISWNIYDKENIKKPIALVLAGIVGIISGMLMSKSIILAAAPFFGLAGLALVLKYPIVGIFASAFSAPFVPTMVLAGLIVYTSLCFCLEKVLKRDFRWNIEGVGTALGFFLLFMLASSLFSFSRTKSVLVWGLYLIFIGYYFVITNALKTEEQIFSIIKVFVLAGLFVSIYGIAQYVFGWNTSNAWIDEEMFENATMRAYSTMENPNVLGEYLLLIIPLSAFLMIKAKFNSIEKLFWLGTLAAGTLCMVLTQSRGCWIGLFVAAILFVTFYNGKLWGLLPFLILALPFILPQTIIDRFLSVGNLEDSSTSYRVFIWLGTLSMLRDFWIGGIGMGEGAFRSIYPFYSYNSITAPHSHNLYLQLLVEGGICAIIIFAVVLILYIRKTAMFFSEKGKKDYGGLLALICVCAVSGFLVQSMFDYTFYNYRMMSMFFMLLGFSVALENTEGGSNIEGN